jgi:hypothetical protein
VAQCKNTPPIIKIWDLKKKLKSYSPSFKVDFVANLREFFDKNLLRP